METIASLSDTELFYLLKQGQTSAFEVIYKRYYPQLFKAAWQKLGCRDHACELTQDVFVQLYQKRTAIGHTEHLSGYLFTLLRNRMVDAYRQQKRKKVLELRLRQKQASTTPPVEGQLDRKQLELQIVTVINNLSPKCRAVFLMSRMQQLSHQQIAHALHLSTSTVEKHIGKALKAIRENLQSEPV